MAVPFFTFNIPSFRQQFKQFSDAIAFTDMTLQAYWDTASQYIANQTQSLLIGGMTNPQLLLALNLMTAHIAALGVMIADGNGQVPGMVTGATIDKVSVTLEPPPFESQFQWWLNLTPYGQQLLALLQVQSVGGVYIGGALELAGMRRARGIC